MNNELTKINYEGIKDIAKKISELGENNATIGKIFKDTINSFKEDKSLSSKVITPSMENMINEIDKVDTGFKNLSEKFSLFLEENVVGNYNKSDNNTKSLWSNENKGDSKFMTLEHKENTTKDTNTKDEYIQGTTYTGNTRYDNYTDEEFTQLAAIIAGEDNKSYEGALAVASAMCNRADKDAYPSDPLSVAKVPKQFTAYGGDMYNKYIKGEATIPDYVVQATKDALSGTRNTTHVNFRPSNGDGRIQIGNNGNYFFG